MFVLYSSPHLFYATKGTQQLQHMICGDYIYYFELKRAKNNQTKGCLYSGYL